MAKAITDANEIPSESEFKKSMGVTMRELKRFKTLTKQEGALLMPAQAAAMLGISPQAMERKVKEGTIKSYAVMGKVWVSGKQIEELMEKRVRKLIDAGQDKNKIEKSMYKKMYRNSVEMIRKSRQK